MVSNGLNLSWYDNGEYSICLIIKPENRKITQHHITNICQQLAHEIRCHLGMVIDTIPAKDSITLLLVDTAETTAIKSFCQSTFEQLAQNKTLVEGTKHIIPVCYDPNLNHDLQSLSEMLKLSPDEIIEQHSTSEYYLQMLGFLPGFCYLTGLNKQLHLPRKTTPEINVPAGSIAIAEDMTGIYSLSSPGGWWVIGRTPVQLFDIDKQPPIALKPMDRVVFQPISFQQWLELSDD